MSSRLQWEQFGSDQVCLSRSSFVTWVKFQKSDSDGKALRNVITAVIGKDIRICAQRLLRLH